MYTHLLLITVVIVTIISVMVAKTKIMLYNYLKYNISFVGNGNLSCFIVEKLDKDSYAFLCRPNSPWPAYVLHKSVIL